MIKIKRIDLSGNNLREARIRSKLTFDQISEITKISRGQISYIFSQYLAKSISLENAEKLANLFNTDVKTLFPNYDKPLRNWRFGKSNRRFYDE